MLQRIEPSTSGLQGEWFIHYTIVAPTVWGGGRGGIVVMAHQQLSVYLTPREISAEVGVGILGEFIVF